MDTEDEEEEKEEDEVGLGDEREEEAGTVGGTLEPPRLCNKICGAAAATATDEAHSRHLLRW